MPSHDDDDFACSQNRPDSRVPTVLDTPSVLYMARAASLITQEVRLGGHPTPNSSPLRLYDHAPALGPILESSSPLIAKAPITSSNPSSSSPKWILERDLVRRPMDKPHYNSPASPRSMQRLLDGGFVPALEVPIAPTLGLAIGVEAAPEPLPLPDFAEGIAWSRRLVEQVWECGPTSRSELEGPTKARDVARNANSSSTSTSVPTHARTPKRKRSPSSHNPLQLFYGSLSDTDSIVPPSPTEVDSDPPDGDEPEELPAQVSGDRQDVSIRGVHHTGADYMGNRGLWPGTGATPPQTPMKDSPKDFIRDGQPSSGQSFYPFTPSPLTNGHFGYRPKQPSMSPNGAGVIAKIPTKLGMPRRLSADSESKCHSVYFSPCETTADSVPSAVSIDQSPFKKFCRSNDSPDLFSGHTDPFFR
jgi:hypothetical protein